MQAEKGGPWKKGGGLDLKKNAQVRIPGWAEKNCKINFLHAFWMSFFHCGFLILRDRGRVFFFFPGDPFYVLVFIEQDRGTGRTKMSCKRIF